MMARKRVPLVECLERMAPREQSRVLMALALGATRMIKYDACLIPLAEDIVFHLHVLAHCEDRLRNARVRWVVGYGMQLDDVRCLVKDPAALSEACDRIERAILRFMTSERVRDEQEKVSG